MKIDRTKLPYRKNCEGYFIFKEQFIVARDTGKGYIEFPGGGVDDDEDVKKALLREALEETGCVVRQLKSLEKIFIDWDESWAKTDKQRERYKKYRGDEMSLFSGIVEKFVRPEGDIVSNEPAWQEAK